VRYRRNRDEIQKSSEKGRKKKREDEEDKHFLFLIDKCFSMTKEEFK
jgi:hypothetical protein